MFFLHRHLHPHCNLPAAVGVDDGVVQIEERHALLTSALHPGRRRRRWLLREAKTDHKCVCLCKGVGAWLARWASEGVGKNRTERTELLSQLQPRESQSTATQLSSSLFGLVEYTYTHGLGFWWWWYRRVGGRRTLSSASGVSVTGVSASTAVAGAASVDGSSSPM